ncbi:Stage V sporulation protein S [compost metagenome]
MSNDTTATILRVSSKSNPASVAGAITGVIRERGRCEAQGIGAGAVNQIVKAIAIARGYVAPNGIELVAIPAFLDLDLPEGERTAIRFAIERR